MKSTHNGQTANEKRFNTLSGKFLKPPNVPLRTPPISLDSLESQSASSSPDSAPPPPSPPPTTHHHSLPPPPSPPPPPHPTAATDSAFCCSRKTKGGGIMKKKRNKKTTKKTKGKNRRKWSKQYKDSINCKKPKGFSQRQHCLAKSKKRKLTKKK